MMTPPLNHATWKAPLALLVLALLVSLDAFAQRTPIKTPQPLPNDITPKVLLGQCGDYEGHYGPLDYRSADPRDKRMVEGWHFDMELSTFLQGKLAGKNKAGSGDVAGGFQYTLKSFPNHPRALFAMEQLGRKLNSERPQHTDYPLECWYLRAFQIAPDDPNVRALYAMYLANRGRNSEALHNLAIADEELRGDANMQYNIGLTYFKLQKYELAQMSALRAASLGFQLEGLERQLKKAGRWNPALILPDEETRPLPAKDAGPSGERANGQ